MTAHNELLGQFSSLHTLLVSSQVVACEVLQQFSYRELAFAISTPKTYGGSFQGKRGKAVTSLL